MAEHPIQGVLNTTMQKIREMVDVNTVIGDPISTTSGQTIIPVSKVSFGFASGGSDLPTKTPKEEFGGGAGAGITIKPIAFLVVGEDSVKLLQLSNEANTANWVNMVPEVIDKISDLVTKSKKDKKEAAKPAVVEEIE